MRNVGTITRIAAALVFAAASTAIVTSLKAQEYPAFYSPATQQNSATPIRGVNAAQVPNGYFNSVSLAVYATGNNALGYAIMPDGMNPVYASQEPNNVPLINCYASSPNTCTAAVAVFNGTIYIAYADYSRTGIDVVTATPVAGNYGYTFTEVHQDNSVNPTTSPAMAVYNGKLNIIFGASNDPNVRNAFYQITYDGTNWSQADESQLGANSIASGAQPGLAVFNNQLWMTLQQNNSQHQLFVFNSTDGVTWSLARQVSNLALGGSTTMVVFNGSLVMAVQQNNSNQSLFIFSSSDGYNWGAQQYPGIRMGAGPALSLFNADIALAFKANDSRYIMFTDLASY